MLIRRLESLNPLSLSKCLSILMSLSRAHTSFIGDQFKVSKLWRGYLTKLPSRYIQGWLVMVVLTTLEWAPLRLEWLPSGDKMDTVPVLAPAMVAKE